MDEIAIKIDNVSMYYNLSKDKVDSLKEYIIKLLKRQLFYDEFCALDNVSFEIKKGEVFGLIGLNGAGKSTLLKLVAGVMKPTKGTVFTNGIIAPLIELGAGFDPDLTARENVYMNGAVLGYSKRYMENNYERIMNFAELWDFQDVPVKNFSSGMYARLGFAIATMVDPQILIIDEILAVGDFKFQEKCHKKIQSLMKDSVTVLLVSHDINTIKNFCNRVAWLEKGKLIKVGNTVDICNIYEQS